LSTINTRAPMATPRRRTLVGPNTGLNIPDLMALVLDTTPPTTM
jgi:hypothetical protein